MSGVGRNRGNNRKGRLNKTGSTEFIGFSAFQNKTNADSNNIAKNNATSALNNPNLTSSTTYPTTSASSTTRFTPSPIFKLGVNSTANNVSELSTLFKKIGRKRDSTTRSKALSDLCAMAFSTNSAETKEQKCSPLTKPQIIATLSHLTFLFYTKLAHDNDRTVRAQALHCLVEAKHVVPKAWHALMQHPCSTELISYSSAGETISISPSVLGVIWCLQSDPAAEVQREAKKCVKDLNIFDKIENDPEKDNDASTDTEKNDMDKESLLGGIMAHILSILKHSRPSSLAEVYSKTKSSLNDGSIDNAFSKKSKNDRNSKNNENISVEDERKEDEERFERVISCTLRALQIFIIQCIRNPTSNGRGYTTSQDLLLANGKIIWKHIVSSRHAFRRESYKLISSFSQSKTLNVTILHETFNPEIHLYSSLSTEKDPSNHPFLFEATILYLSSFSSKIDTHESDNNNSKYRWKNVDSQLLCKHLSKLLKKSCYGSPANGWAPLLLPLIHLLPTSTDYYGAHEDSQNRDWLALPCQLIASMWEGKQSSVLRKNDEVAVISAVAECSTYLLLRKADHSTNIERTQSMDMTSYVFQLCDFFNSSLLYYLQSTTFSSNSRRGLSSSMERDLLNCLARNLYRIDIVCQQEQKDSETYSLTYDAKDYLWGTSGNYPSSESKNHNGIIFQTLTSCDMNVQSAQTLQYLIETLGDNALGEHSKEDASSNHNETSSSEISPLRTSLLIRPMQHLINIVITKSRGNRLSKEEIQLLYCIINRFGVKNVLPSSLPSANLFMAEEMHPPQTNIATSTTIEYFCMNELLKLTIMMGHKQHFSNGSDTVILTLFNMLRCCIEAISSPLHQKKVWEAFFNELIIAECSLKTLSLGFNVLSTHTTIDLLRCKALENFALKVGVDAANTFRYGQKELTESHTSEEKSVSDIFTEEKNNTITEVSDVNGKDLAVFLQTCLGLIGSSVILVSAKVISRWVELACPSIYDQKVGEEIDRKHQVELLHDENDPNILLETLISFVAVSLKKVEPFNQIISKGETVNVIIEAWYQKSRAWSKEALPLFISNGMGELSSTASTIVDDVLYRSSSILKEELHHPLISKEDTIHPNKLVNMSLEWTSRAWRLICLYDRTNTVQGSFDHLELIGLANLELWESQPSNGSEWLFLCLFHLLLHYHDDTDRENVFLGNNIRDASRLLERILNHVFSLSPPNFLGTFQPTTDSLMEVGKLLIDTIFADDTKKTEKFYDFLEMCCNETVCNLPKLFEKSMSSPPRNQNSFIDIRTLDILTSYLFGEVHLSLDKKVEDGDVLNANEINVGDIVWYEHKPKADSENQYDSSVTNRVQAKILKIHTDDFPNLYFTIGLTGEKGFSERQTVASRLKKSQYSSCTTDSDPTIGPGQQRSKESDLRARRLEHQIFDKIVKCDFSSYSPERSNSSVLKAASKCVNIILNRCGLGDNVGLGSLRYDIFQIISNLDRTIVEILGKSKVDENAIKTLHYLSFTMMGNTSAQSSSFVILRYNDVQSLNAICKFYESEERLIPNDIALDFHSSVLMWISVSSSTIRSPSFLSRISIVLNEVAKFILHSQDMKYEELSLNSHLIMRTMNIIQDVHATMCESGKSIHDSIYFDCAEDLIRGFATIWGDSDVKTSIFKMSYLADNTKPVWFSSFSSLLSNPHDTMRDALRFGAKKLVNELCDTLFIPNKRLCGFYLLRTVAINSSTTLFENDTLQTFSCEDLLDLSSKDMTDDERDELEEDFNIASKCLPRKLMEEIECWGVSADSQTKNGTDNFGQLLTWLIMLDFLESAGNIDSRNRSAISSYIQASGAVNVILDNALLSASLKEKPDETFISNGTPISLSQIHSEDIIPKVANIVIFRTVQVLPTLTKLWWNDYCPRGNQSQVKLFVQTHVAPEILRRELCRIETANNLGEMQVNGSGVSREVTATYVQDECQLSVMIRIPPSFPLRNVEVDCQKTKGIAEKRWRRWSLQIMRMLNSQDGTVLDALMLWKENVDKEFEGVEPCPVCYSVLCVKTHAMPNLECKTCHNRFHSTCLYKWFHSSGKSQCVLCQQPWSGTKV